PQPSEMAACCQVVAPFGNGGLVSPPRAGPTARAFLPGAGTPPRAAVSSGGGPGGAGGVHAPAGAARPPRSPPPAPPRVVTDPLITGTLPAAFAGVVTDAAMSTLIAG